MGILAILMVIMAIQRWFRCKKTNTPFINLKGYHFFRENWDKKKLIGGILVFVAYVYTMENLSDWLWNFDATVALAEWVDNYGAFIPCSILAIFAWNMVYYVGKLNKKAVGLSVLISVVATVLVYVVFGQIFMITLP
jgi:hypothetical protein